MDRITRFNHLFLFVIPILHLLLAGCDRRELSEGQNPQKTGDSAAVRPTTPPPFRGTRAFEHLVTQTSFGPRNPNSIGAARCLEFLSRFLAARADTLVYQRFTHSGYGETLRLTNVFARFRPEAPSRIILLAHWDTRPRADRDPDFKRQSEPIIGANDGASGVAVLLEIADILKQVPPPVGVDILLTDGEDYGLEGDTDNYLLGARHFARTRPTAYAPRFGILLDLVGDANLELPQEGFSLQYAPNVVRAVWTAARLLGVHQFIDVPGQPIMDDHLPLNEVGIPTINIIDFEYPDASHRYWHTHNDTPDKCSPVSLEAVGRVVCHIIYNQIP